MLVLVVTDANGKADRYEMGSPECAAIHRQLRSALGLTADILRMRMLLTLTRGAVVVDGVQYRYADK